MPLLRTDAVVTSSLDGSSQETLPLFCLVLIQHVHMTSTFGRGVWSLQATAAPTTPLGPMKPNKRLLVRLNPEGSLHGSEDSACSDIRQGYGSAIVLAELQLASCGCY